MQLLLMILIVVVTFFFGDSILTPLLLLLWKKFWLLLLKMQALLTKKNILQTMVQSLLLAGKALLRLINKTITAWILPLLMTRRQRYWLHHALVDARKHARRRALRAWVRWRRLPVWLKALTLGPAAMLAVAFFVGSGFLLAGIFGVGFIIPWIGGLPLATIVIFRRALARLGLFVLERLGVGPVVNRAIDRFIGLIWWKTPEPVQRRFDAWWRRMKMRMRRRVIGPRRQVTRGMKRFRLGKGDGEDRAQPEEPEATTAMKAPIEPRSPDCPGSQDCKAPSPETESKDVDSRRSAGS